MKPEELVASEFLAKHFNRKPIYEPLGKSTAPDFCVDGTAFEVRRLNQRHIHEDGSNEGLEQVDIPLNSALDENSPEFHFRSKVEASFGDRGSGDR